MYIQKIIFYFFLVFSFSQLAGQDTLNDSISLQYGIIGCKGTDKDSLFKIENNKLISTHDSIKINFKYQTGFFYIIFDDKDSFYYNNSIPIDKKIKTTGWIELTNRDNYNIYLILSRTGSQNIEEITAQAGSLLVTKIPKPDTIGVVFRSPGTISNADSLTDSLFFESKAKDLIVEKIQISVK